MMARQRIGEMLVQEGVLDPVQLESALAHQRRWGGRLGRAIVHLGFLDEAAFLSTLGRQLGVPVANVREAAVPSEVIGLVPQKLMRLRKVLPLAQALENRRGSVVVAVTDPADLALLDELAFATGLRVRPVLASEEDLDDAISRHLDGDHRVAHDYRSRPDAIDLPEDTNPLTQLRRGEDGKFTLH
ncbi:MAG: general secretion pathway protein GspE [Anaeromyxobacter sp.]